jgi:hypothetical protein
MNRKRRYNIERRAKIDQRLMNTRKKTPVTVPSNKKESEKKIIVSTPKKFKEDSKTEDEPKTE